MRIGDSLIFRIPFKLVINCLLSTVFNIFVKEWPNQSKLWKPALGWANTESVTLLFLVQRSQNGDNTQPQFLKRSGFCSENHFSFGPAPVLCQSLRITTKVSMQYHAISCNNTSFIYIIKSYYIYIISVQCLQVLFSSQGDIVKNSRHLLQIL